MTRLEAIVKLVNEHFGFDAGVTVYAALRHYKPTDSHIIEYGTRMLDCIREIQEEQS